MLVKIYFSLWVLTAIAAVLMLATGSVTMMTLSVFGFAAFGLTFMGMISVLPVWASHPEEPKAPKPAPQPAPAERKAEGFAVLKSA